MLKRSAQIIRVALAGNPNSGKTSLFNSLVGTHLKVGNWAGVTIEKYEGFVAYKGRKIQFVDLPGTYSLTAYSPEELIARNYIIDEKPDVVVNVVDGTNLERNLYLTTQLMELEADLIIALNMHDEVLASGIKIEVKPLQKLLGCHIVPTSAVKKQGLDRLLDHIVRVYDGEISIAKNKLVFNEELENSVGLISAALETDAELAEKYHVRWLALKLLEGDQAVYSHVHERAVWLRVEKHVADAISRFEKNPGEKITTRVAEDRYAFIRGAVRETVRFPNSEKKTVTDIIDSVLINRFLGLPVFFGIMWVVFQVTFTFGEAPRLWIESLFLFLGRLAAGLMPEGIARSIVVDGIIAGVGGVVGFLPNILLLFLGLSIMEGTGYMARAAFVVDKVFHKIGLHGKSFIPMITGFGCSVPAFMACRTLKNKGDRLATMMVIPFMSCGAKLPVHILIIGAFFPPHLAGNALFGIYLFGIIVAIASAKLFKSTVFKGESEPFVMELPVYRMPTLSSVLMQMWIKAWMYIKKAGTVILTVSLIIWLASNYPRSGKIDELYSGMAAEINTDQNLGASEKEMKIAAVENERLSKQLQYSAAGRIGMAIEPVIRPLGFDWRLGVALTAGFAAKEVIVSTMGTIYAMGEVNEGDKSLQKILGSDPAYSLPVALSLLVFVLLYVPCMAATTVFHKEAGEVKWTVFYVVFSMTTAWVLAFAVYRISSLFLG